MCQKATTTTLKNTSTAPRRRRRRIWRRFLPVLLFIALVGFGCIARSPSQQAAHHAQQWEQVAQRLLQFNDNRLTAELATTVRTAHPREAAKVMERLTQVKTNASVDRKAWVVGRAYLWAATHYLAAARHSIRGNHLDDTRKHCRSAARCLTEAAKWLPSWERENVQKWANQTQGLAQRIGTDPFYIMTHLTALHAKALAHAKFVPPLK